MNELLEMGGHGMYIWPCYGMAAVLLVSLLVVSMKSLSKSKKDLSVMEQLANGGESS